MAIGRRIELSGNTGRKTMSDLVEVSPKIRHLQMQNIIPPLRMV